MSVFMSSCCSLADVCVCVFFIFCPFFAVRFSAQFVARPGGGGDRPPAEERRLRRVPGRRQGGEGLRGG